MAVENVTVNTSTGVDGSSFTSSISNDELTNDDFLTLMIQELKLQDPTSPMDSSQMLTTQMQMSSIQTNQELAAAMASLQTSFSQSSLANAANIIGKNIEDGNIGETGINKAYTVKNVENVDGDVRVNAQEILYLEDRVLLSDGDDTTSDEIINYNVAGEILDENGNTTGNKIALQEPGFPLVRDGKLVVLDENNEEITDHKYKLAGTSTAVYSDEITQIPFSQISRIF